MYPVMLAVRERRCLVVGGGGVALRKVDGLVAQGARVTVVAPEPVLQLEALARDGRIELERRAYRVGEASGFALVFAATDDREVNRQVFEDAEAAGKWVNVADDPPLCTFHLPARVERGALQLAIASAGGAPFAVRRLRQMLARRFGAEWSEWMEAATRFRRLVRSLRRPRDAEEACYDAFFAATVDAARLEARVPTADEEARLVGLTPQAVEAALGDGDRDRASAGGGDGDAARGAGTDAAPAGTDAAPAGTDAAPAGTDAAPAGTDAAPADGNSAAGFVSLVGAGPGDAGLMTLRGRQRLLAARAVVYDRLAATALPCDLPDTVELHCVGKQAGRHPVPQEEINALLVRLARRGWRVVRLKGGDPFVFGRGGEEAEALVEAGIPFEIVPAVTAGVAVPAYAGIPITHRRESVRATFVTAHEAVKRRGPQVRWDLLAADPHATLVGYMGVTALPQVAERLITAGLDPATPAAMIESGTTARQRVVRDTIAGLAAAVTAAGLEPPGLFVIGPTVRHAEHLDWFASRPLHGERLVAVAPAGTLGSALELRGAEVVEVTLPIRPAARVVMGALPVSGCVVRSADEVDALDEEREGRGWGPDVVAWCLGAETARRAAARGWRHVVPVESPSALAARMIERRAHRDCESLSR